MINLYHKKIKLHYINNFLILYKFINNMDLDFRSNPIQIFEFRFIEIQIVFKKNMDLDGFGLDFWKSTPWPPLANICEYTQNC